MLVLPRCALPADGCDARPLAIASDKTDLSKEQSAEPVYIVSNALPLHERMHTADRTTAYMCMHTLHPHAHALHDALHAALHDVVALSLIHI